MSRAMTWCSAYVAGPWGDGDYWVRDMTVDRPHGRVVGVRDTPAGCAAWSITAVGASTRFATGTAKSCAAGGAAAVPAVQRGGVEG